MIGTGPALAMLALLAIGGITLTHNGAYGLTLFVAIPFLIGAVTAWPQEPKSAAYAAGLGGLGAGIATGALLFVGVEGIICIAMALPLTVPLGCLGGLLAYWLRTRAAESSTFALLLLLPSATLPWDVIAKPDVFQVHSSIEIAAPPEQVWKNVVSFSDLPEPEEWYFKTGIAYPRRAHIEGTGAGAVRYCEFSTGPFVEPIETWDEPRLLRFRVTSNPAPMNEWSPYAHVLPKHLHGYLISKQGQFKLTPLPGGRTLLEGTTWYQHGLWPANYWRLWSEAIIHRIHMRVLNHIRNLSEQA